MTDPNHSEFISGSWRGYYSYRKRLDHIHWMRDVMLTFRDGLIDGSGLDGIGPYSIKGHYDPQTGECRWIQTHADSHQIFFAGFREGKGIWGAFKTGPARGEFLVWPSGSHEYSNKPNIDEVPKAIEVLTVTLYERIDS